MRIVNVHEAKSTLSRLIEAVEAGEDVTIARAGRPVARLVRANERAGVRIGTVPDLVRKISRDFDKPLSAAQFEALFGGSVEP